MWAAGLRSEWRTLLGAAPYHVLPTLGALCGWHELSFTFPSNPMAPQGLTDILKEEKPLVLQMHYTSVTKSQICQKWESGCPLSHREEKSRRSQKT